MEKEKNPHPQSMDNAQLSTPVLQLRPWDKPACCYTAPKSWRKTGTLLNQAATWFVLAPAQHCRRSWPACWLTQQSL